MNGSINETLARTLNDALSAVVSFIPRFVSGLIVLLIGLIIASFLKQVLLQLFKFIKLDAMLARYGVPEAKGKEAVSWSAILAEIVRWFVIILFLVPTVDIWGLEQFVEVLNGLLGYLPSVFVAVLLLLIGFAVAKLVYDFLFAAMRGVSGDTAKTVAMVGRWSVLAFVFLVVLNQLGIASDLIRILFGGFVAMIALAGGLAFGMGGRDAAKELIERMVKRL